ncbi:ATP-binding protein [Spirillospora sp. NBC_01491]|uniref:ATP-binding protein n=1 Tax=Spirillospora sp. NBC_01491 TaxID=2976007 RepID=UPI002E2F9AB5|nr:ATP-binding protein [Spirillospora sp. NBC_01491]
MTTLMDLAAAPLALSLSAVDQAPAVRAAVRAYAAKVVADIELLDDIELMASEAITNALLHGSVPVHVTVTTIPGMLRVEVDDQGPPPGSNTSRDDNNGRGLFIIDALAEAWRLTRERQGTRLVFEVLI